MRPCRPNQSPVFLYICTLSRSVFWHFERHHVSPYPYLPNPRMSTFEWILANLIQGDTVRAMYCVAVRIRADYFFKRVVSLFGLNTLNSGHLLVALYHSHDDIITDFIGVADITLLQASREHLLNEMICGYPSVIDLIDDELKSRQ